jgi:hypothetical protein
MKAGKLTEIIAGCLLGLGVLGSGGCTGTYDVFDPYKGQRIMIPTEINGSQGFINRQGLGLVYAGQEKGRDRWFVYEKRNGQWVRPERETKIINGHTYEVIFK